MKRILSILALFVFVLAACAPATEAPPAAPATQEVIGGFGVEKYGQPLFFPDADKTDADLGL